MPKSKYKKRKDGRYLIQIQIGYQDNGKPKYKNLYGKTIQELDKKVIEFKAQLNNGIIIDDQNMTFEKWSMEWLDKYKIGVTERTYNKYKTTIKNHFSSLKGMKLLKIKPYHIQEELNKLAENGHTSLVKFARTTLSQIFKQAIANEYIFKNPMDGVHTPTVELGSRRALTQEERAAINSVDDFTLREKTFIYLCLYAGMRRGEALALMPKDINFKKNEISISKTVVYNSNQPYIKKWYKN